jgi:hypothetical protein
MFRSYNDQIRDATLDAKNNADLKKELDSYTRSKQLSMGILPIEIEALNPNIQRDTAISLLKKYTYQPKAAYAYLFNNVNGIDDFIKFNADFDKMIRGVTNLSLDEFKNEWNYFTTIEMKKPAFIYKSRFTGLKERNKYEDAEKEKRRLEMERLARLESERKERLGVEYEEIYGNPIDLMNYPGRLAIKKEQQENRTIINKAKSASKIDSIKKEEKRIDNVLNNMTAILTKIDDIITKLQKTEDPERKYKIDSLSKLKVSITLIMNNINIHRNDKNYETIDKLLTDANNYIKNTEALINSAESMISPSGSGIRRSRYRKRPLVLLRIPNQWDWQ